MISLGDAELFPEVTVRSIFDPESMTEACKRASFIKADGTRDAWEIPPDGISWIPIATDDPLLQIAINGPADDQPAIAGSPRGFAEREAAKSLSNDGGQA